MEEAADGGGIQHGVNCLEIDLIQVRVLSFFVWNDLLPLRILSAQWNSNAKSIITARGGLPRGVQVRIDIDQGRLMAGVFKGTVSLDENFPEGGNEYDSDEEAEWSSTDTDDYLAHGLDSYKGGEPTYSFLPEYMAYLDSGPDPLFVPSRIVIGRVSLKAPLAQQFLTKFGSTIRSLVLNMDTEESDSYANAWPDLEGDEESDDRTGNAHDRYGVHFLDWDSFRNIILFQCPNLEELRIDSVPQVVKLSRFRMKSDPVNEKLKVLEFALKYQHASPRPAFLRDLFRSFPNLVSVKVTADFDSCPVDDHLLKIISNSRCLPSLKILNLNGITELGVKVLALPMVTSFLRLESLEVRHFPVGAEHQNELHRFLTSQSGCLKTFVVDSWSSWTDVPHSLPPITFPNMPGLEKLSLSFSHKLDFRPIDWGVTFPGLRILALRGRQDDFDLGVALHANSSSASGVVALELPIGLSLNQLILAAIIFPNVKELVLGYVTDLVLRQLWTTWPDLESLLLCTVSPKHNDKYTQEYLGLDSVFTGIDGRYLKKMKKGWNPAQLKCQHPGIWNLSNLKELTVHPGPDKCTMMGSGEKRRNEVTDVSVHFAFSRLLSLEYIFIGSKGISEAAVTSLCQTNPALKRLVSKSRSFFPLLCSSKLFPLPHKSLGASMISPGRKREGSGLAFDNIISLMI